MNRDDVIDILTVITAGDRRTVGEADVALWLGTIGDLHKADAITAVGQHFRTSEKWLMPVHLRTLAMEIAKDRWLRTDPAERNELGQLDADEPMNEAAAPARAAAIGAFSGRTGHSGECYDTSIHVLCPRCKAEPDTYCRNPVNDKAAHLPCLTRLKAAGTPTYREATR